MIADAENQTSEVPLDAFIIGSERGGIEVIDRWADDWRLLCDEAAEDQPFYRPEFIRAHIRAVIPGARVVLVTARFDGRLCLLFPLIDELGTFGNIPLRRLRAPVNFNCGRFDAVRRRGPAGDAAILATWQFLKKMTGWDLLQINDTQEESTVARLVSAAQSDGFRTLHEADRPNPYVPIPDDPELLKQMPPNSKLRSQLRQVRQRMTEQGPLTFSRLQTADRDAINRFFELEASGWKGRSNGAVNCHPQARQFFDELAESAARFGYFSLYMLEWKGHLIAAHFSLTYRSRCYSPIVAYDEAFKQYAPGHLIISEILRDCAARGIQGYDITGQDQPWKMKWTSEVHPVNHHFVFRGPLGALAYAVGTGLKPLMNRLFADRQPDRVKPAGVQERSKAEERHGFPGSSYVACQHFPLSR
jgi:CelD/BcsL family acetyltransferase involved in cellulose biosynthesis